MAREEQSALLCLLLHLKYPQLGRQEVALSALRCIKVLESGVEGHVQSSPQCPSGLVQGRPSFFYIPGETEGAAAGVTVKLRLLRPLVFLCLRENA